MYSKLINKRIQSFILLFFSTNVPQSNNQIINEGKFHFIGVIQIINEEGMIELEYLHFVPPNEIKDLGSGHQ